MRIDPRTLAAWGLVPDRSDPKTGGRPSLPPRVRTGPSIAFLAAVAAVALASPGCMERDATLELTGPEALKRLPPEVAALIPDDSVLRLDQDRADGAYRIWILQRPGGTRLEFSPKPRGMDQHRMPPSALESILQARLPSLERGRPLESHCWFTHWRLADGAEIQIRELVTEQGWFASVERVAM